MAAVEFGLIFGRKFTMSTFTDRHGMASAGDVDMVIILPEVRQTVAAGDLMHKLLAKLLEKVHSSTAHTALVSLASTCAAPTCCDVTLVPEREWALAIAALVLPDEASSCSAGRLCLTDQQCVNRSRACWPLNWGRRQRRA